MDKIEIKVRLSVLKPVADVFDAVVNPTKLSGYLVQTASGPFQEGKQVTWRFPEFPMNVPITVGKVVPSKLVTFEWGDRKEGSDTSVTIEFEALDKDSTSVQVTETGWQPDEKGRENSYRNNTGWMHMLCCLKAYLEYGINLRKGSFIQKDFGG